jgi:hypothetical protein
MDIQELTQAMHRFVASRGWYEPDSPRPQTLRNLAISLNLEAAELLEHFQWKEEISPFTCCKSPAFRKLTWNRPSYKSSKKTTLAPGILTLVKGGKFSKSRTTITILKILCPTLLSSVNPARGVFPGPNYPPACAGIRAILA